MWCCMLISATTTTRVLATMTTRTMPTAYKLKIYSSRTRKEGKILSVEFVRFYKIVNERHVQIYHILLLQNVQLPTKSKILSIYYRNCHRHLHRLGYMLAINEKKHTLTHAMAHTLRTAQHI